MILWIPLGIAVAIFAAIALQIDDWSRDWTHNTARLDPAAERAELRPVVMNDGISQTVDRIINWANAEPGWEFVSESSQGGEPFRIQLTRTTSLMGFVDDIEVEIDSLPDGGAVVHASSRSRVGKGDLGQNPRNLIELTTALREESS